MDLQNNSIYKVTKQQILFVFFHNFENALFKQEEARTTHLGLTAVLFQIYALYTPRNTCY